MKRRFTKDFKLSILGELDSKKLAEVCRIHDLHPSTVSGWRKDYNANPTEAFKGHGNIWKEEAKLAEKDRLIGQLYAENAFLKKALEKLKQLQVEEKRKWRSLLRGSPPNRFLLSMVVAALILKEELIMLGSVRTRL